MGVVDQPVQDGAGQGGILHGGMPCLQRQLNGDDGRLSFMQLFNDLQDLPLFFLGHGVDQQIIQDQHLAFAEWSEDLGIAAIKPGKGDLVQHSGRSLAEG